MDHILPCCAQDQLDLIWAHFRPAPVRPLLTGEPSSLPQLSQNLAIIISQAPTFLEAVMTFANSHAQKVGHEDAQRAVLTRQVYEGFQRSSADSEVLSL